MRRGKTFLFVFFWGCTWGSLRAGDCKTRVLLSGAIPADGSLRIAQEVEITRPGSLPFQAYFVGSDSAYLYFSKPGSLDLILLDSRQVDFPRKPTRVCYVGPRTQQSNGNSAAVGILGCLRILEDLEGMPPGRLNLLLQKFPWYLAEALEREFGENTPGETVRSVERFLTRGRVPFVSTRSVPELLAHLEKSYPAYLALGVTLSPESERSEDERDSVLAPDRTDQNAFPGQRDTTSDFLGFVAFGKLPAGRWFTGGEKVALIDSLTARVALWPAKALGRTPHREFVLISPYRPD